MFVKMLTDVYVLCSMLVCILTVIMCTAAVETHGLKPPASDFSRHSIVQPVVVHGRTKREISTTRDGGGTHHSEVTMKVPINGKEFVLDLRLNQDLMTDNHVLSYQKDGDTVIHTPKKEELDFCHYGGSVRDKPGSWVAVSTCHGVQGIVFDGERMRYIEPAQGGGVNSKHYVYASTDLYKALPRSFHHRITNSSYVDLGKKTLSRHKRSASRQSEIRAPYNANKNSRYVELVLVADRGLYEENEGNVGNVYRQMKALANIIYALYSPLNIFVALVGVEVWTNRDEIQIDPDSAVTLDNFMKYRSTNLVKRIPNDNAHLITTQDFYDSVLGKAHPETICSLQKSGGIESYYTSVVGLLAMAIAHEMGHNLGMHHDDEVADCECREKSCIMSSSSNSRLIPVWSTCSLNSLAYSFSKGVDYCLKNKPEQLFSSPTCGNGFVEPGEQCDCGTVAVEGAYNPCHACCDPNTCMLRANATCGAGMCCDLQTCRPKSADTVCRSADRECDLPEYCTGHSEYCPDDVFKMDTTPCGQGEQSAYCMRGECRSHSVQCRLLWGPTGKSSHDKCYDHNKQGNKEGDCGYDFLEDRYSACHANDIMCGRLQCNHLSESGDNVNHLEFGSGSPFTSLYQDGDTIGPCYTVAIDLVKDVGLVPDGAKCGHDMMCLNQRCLPVTTVREVMATSICPSNCSGHGVCDSSGQCQCEPGYEPPLCTLRRRDNSNTRRSDYNRPVDSTIQNPTVHNYNTPGIRTNSQNPTRPGIRNNNSKPTTHYYTSPGIRATSQKPTILYNNTPVIRTNAQNPTRPEIRTNNRYPNTSNNNRSEIRTTTRKPIIYNNNIPVIRTYSQNPTRPGIRTNNHNPNTSNNNRPEIRDITQKPKIYNNNIPVIRTDSQNPTRPGIRNNYRNPTTVNHTRPGIRNNYRNPTTVNHTRPGIRNNYRNPTTVNHTRPGIRNNYRNPTTVNHTRPGIRTNYRNPTTVNHTRPGIRTNYRNPNTFNNNRPGIRINYRNLTAINYTRPGIRTNYQNPTRFNYSRPGIRTNYQNPTRFNYSRPGIRTNYRNPKQSTLQEPYVDTSSTDSSNRMVALYVFLGIIPLILLTLFLIYYFHSNLLKQYKDFQRKLSIKSNAPEKRNHSIPKPNCPINAITADLQGPIYANNDRIKTHETLNRNDRVPEEVIQKIRAANDISKVFDAKQMTSKVVKPTFSPPAPPPVKPKPAAKVKGAECRMHVSRENLPTFEAKGAESKLGTSTGTKHRKRSIEGSSLYRNIVKKNVNYSPIE